MVTLGNIIEALNLTEYRYVKENGTNIPVVHRLNGKKVKYFGPKTIIKEEPYCLELRNNLNVNLVYQDRRPNLSLRTIGEPTFLLVNTISDEERKCVRLGSNELIITISNSEGLYKINLRRLQEISPVFFRQAELICEHTYYEYSYLRENRIGIGMAHENPLIPEGRFYTIIDDKSNEIDIRNAVKGIVYAYKSLDYFIGFLAKKELDESKILKSAK